MTSTNYPNGYPNNEDHTQTIRVPKGNTIRINFLDFRIEREPRREFVTVTDDDGTQLARLDGESEWLKEIVSKTETVHVRFFTDGSVSAPGWRLSWGEKKTMIEFLSYLCFNPISQDWLGPCQRMEF